MEWTTKLPDREGFYWLKHRSAEPEIIYVRKSGTSFEVCYMDINSPDYLPDDEITFLNYKWKGPLTSE